MFCRNCGSQIPTGASYCHICGKAAAASAEERVNMFTALTKYAQFSGRSRRKEFWLWCLGQFLILFFTRLIFTIACQEPMITESIMLLLYLVFLLPDLAVAVRRLHDTGRSGWNILWSFLPLIGGIIMLIFYCSDSQPGPNRYGENPKGE